MKTPITIDDLFPSKWLKPDDLNGRSYTLTISHIDFEELHNPRTNGKELKAIVVFRNAEKRLPLNKTQSLALADIAQSRKYADWSGTRLTLKVGRARNGKDTIIITPAPAPQPAAQPDPAPPADDALFNFQYQDGTEAEEADHLEFNRYRRANDEEAPYSKIMLSAWIAANPD